MIREMKRSKLDWLRWQVGRSEQKTVTPIIYYPDGRQVATDPVQVGIFHLYGWGSTEARATLMARLNGFLL